MRTLFISLVALCLLAGCQKSDDEKAQALLSKIEKLHARRQYRETLDSITSLRERFPQAIEARKRALVLWQDASLHMAQEDVGKTDLLLQETLADIEREQDLYKANMLRVRRDSLKARYDALCGVVRMIHMRQKESR